MDKMLPMLLDPMVSTTMIDQNEKKKTIDWYKSTPKKSKI